VCDPVRRGTILAADDDVLTSHAGPQRGACRRLRQDRRGESIAPERPPRSVIPVDALLGGRSPGPEGRRTGAEVARRRLAPLACRDPVGETQAGTGA
jgi:hypothetical protein